MSSDRPAGSRPFRPRVFTAPRRTRGGLSTVADKAAPKPDEPDAEESDPRPLTPGPSASGCAGPTSVKPALAMDAFDFAGHTVRAASIRGTYHRASSEREDDYAIRATEDQLVVVVSDGVGTSTGPATVSRATAHVAADAAVRWLTAGTHPNDDRVAFARTVANAIIATVAPSLDSPDDLGGVGATMTCLVLPALGEIAHVLAVGDSPVTVLSDDGSWHLATCDDGGLVHALPRHPTRAWTAELPLEGTRSITVMSDGLLPAFRDPSVRQDMALGLACPLPPSAYLELVQFDLPEAVDDRTAVTVWPRCPDPHTGF